MGAVTGGMSTMNTQESTPTSTQPAPFFNSGGLTLTKRTPTEGAGLESVLPGAIPTKTPTFKTEYASKAFIHANSMASAQEMLNEFDTTSAKGLNSWWEMGKKGTPFLPSGMKGANLQKQEQAERRFVLAVNRKDSGATITPVEMEEGRLLYFPQPQDSAEVVDQKRLNRDQAIKDAYVQAGQPVPEFLVRDKDGVTGRIPANEFDPTLHTKL